MRLLRYMAAVALLIPIALPAAADTMVCVDANREATAEIDIVFTDEARDAGQITRVIARAGDHAVATETSDPDGRPDVLFDPVVTSDMLEVYLLDSDEVRIVFALRLFRDFRFDGTDTEYEEHVVAGTMRMMGAGVWAVSCVGW